MSKIKHRIFLAGFISFVFFFSFFQPSQAGFFDWFRKSDSQEAATVVSKAKQYTLSVSKSGSGVVISDDGKINCGNKCEAFYPANSKIVLKAEAGDNYKFERWNGCDKVSDGQCQTTLNKSKMIVAKFVSKNPNSSQKSSSKSFSASSKTNNSKPSDTSSKDKLCAQVITSAKNKTTGECKEFSNACIPSGWEKVGVCSLSKSASSMSSSFSSINESSSKSSQSANQSSSSSKKIPPTPGPTCLSNYTFNPITNNELTENIVFAINEEYAASHSEWQQRAQEVIDYVNNVLSKNTQKRYKIAKFLTYPTSKYSTLLNDSNYYLINNNYGGTTFFYYVYDQKSNVPTIVSDTGLVNVASKSVINGQTFYSLWLVTNDNMNILMGKSLLNKKSDDETYDRFMTTPLHELGHTLGLAYGEWYSYDFTDTTNISPNLGEYSFRDIYPYDPMTTSEKFPYKFSGLNEALINLNANHQYSFADIAKMHATKTIVRVKNTAGSPVSGAIVKVFGAKKNAYYIKNKDQPLLQSLQTDSNGTAEIDNIDSNFQMSDSPTVGWIAKIIKVSKNGKSSGSIFTLVDSQNSCIINKSQTHYIDIKID